MLYINTIYKLALCIDNRCTQMSDILLNSTGAYLCIPKLLCVSHLRDHKNSLARQRHVRLATSKSIVNFQTKVDWYQLA